MKKLLCLIFVMVIIFTSCSKNEQSSSNKQSSLDNMLNSTNPIPIEEKPAEGSFTNEPIIIGEGTDYPINGILFVPDKADGKVPAVVLVHGSGPSDMDETIYGNKPFRDIAEFLAANGIAVIRYDKRTYIHGEKMVNELGGNLTVREETIEDAILAEKILRADTRIDENKIFMLGHSLGGMLAPRIQSEGGSFNGFILLAGSPRPLTEVFLEQMRASIDAALEDGLVEFAEVENTLAELDALEEFFATLHTISDEEAKEYIIPMMGIPAFYLKDLEVRSFADYVKDVSVPILVMQGSRDFQVLADVDFVILKELLEERDNVDFKFYEELNHLFMYTKAKNFVEHANDIVTASGNIALNVLQDIAEWISAQ